MAPTTLPINRTCVMQGRRVDILLEDGRVYELTLAPGALVTDWLEQRDITLPYVEVPRGIGTTRQ